MNQVENFRNENWYFLIDIPSESCQLFKLYKIAYMVDEKKYMIEGFGDGHKPIRLLINNNELIKGIHQITPNNLITIDDKKIAADAIKKRLKYVYQYYRNQGITIRLEMLYHINTKILQKIKAYLPK